MKKLLSLCLAFTLLLTGCSQSHEPEIKSSVEGFATALKDGDYNKAMSYCSDDVNDNLQLSDLDEQLKEMYEGLGLGETFETKANEFVTSLVGRIIEKYEIKSLAEEKESATVIMNVTGVDTEKLDFNDMSGDVNTLTNEYLTQNQDALNALYLEQGEEALQNKVTEDLGTILFDKMIEYVKQTDTMDYQIEFTVEPKDDKWVITKIEAMEK